MDPTAPIGVLDTGVGGYTVLRVLRQELPREDVVFYGDGWNVPYGNRSEEEILCLVRQCLDFLAGRGVKLVAVACNTISSLIERYRDEYPFPILSIVQAGSDQVLALRAEEVGVFSTVFTARSGCYQRLIARQAPQVRVHAQGSQRLAALIEGGAGGELLDEELDASLGRLAALHPELDTLVLGCTHFPIEEERIRSRYPQFTRLIDPAWMQVWQVRDCLAEAGGLNRQTGEGALRICTSGDCEKYQSLARRLALRPTGGVERVPPPVLKK